MNPGKYFNILLLSVLLVVSFLAAGCFDVKSEIQMNPDGSGMENVYVTVDK